MLDNDSDNDSDKKNGKGKKAKRIIYRLRFIDSCRFMQDSLSNLVDNLSGINKFIDNMRSMVFSLTQSINKTSEIDRKISQIDKKEADNTFTDSMRSMMSSLSQSIDRVSEIDRKISHAALIEKFYDTYQLSNKDLNKFALLLKRVFILMNTWIAGINLTNRYDW